MGRSLLAPLLLVLFSTSAFAAPKVAAIRLSGGLPESAGQVGLFGDIEQNLYEFTARLDRAAQDDDVEAVLLRLRDVSLGRGKIEEVRAAIERVQREGKPVIAQLESGMMADYLIASACDEIIMPESGVLIIPGIRTEVTYYKGLFDKLGIEADMMHVGDYKGAAEPYTRTGMSPAVRKQFDLLVDDLYAQMIEMIATDRELPRGRVKEMIDQGLFASPAAKKAGLIDKVAYSDQIPSYLADKLDDREVEIVANYGRIPVDVDFSGMLGMVKMFEMLLGNEPTVRAGRGKKVAVVYAVGAIMSGESSASLFGESTLGSDTVIAALRQANKDDSVAAIVLRIDSPGGSALASDLIWRAIQEIEKPVIASMGDTAASGGYYIAMGCDAIIAEPGCITGSIGVVGGKFAIKGAYDKIGLNTDVISRGQNSGMLSMEQKFTETERAAFKGMMEETYRQFVSKAAAGRDMEVAAIEKLAGGRIWTGKQAAKNGLVDEVGTLRDAIKYAKSKGGIPSDEKAEILFLPKPKSILDLLLEEESDPLSDIGTAVTIDTAEKIAPELSEQLKAARDMQRMFKEPSVLMAPYRVRIR